MSPKVSVVMPVYNQERYLPAAVHSILNQTYSDFELVIVNNGSTDNTLDVLSKIKDSRIRIIHSGHTGFLDAIKRGLNEAQGEWIARMDSDDISHPNRLEKQIEFLSSHPECVYVATSYGIVTPNDKYLAPSFSSKWHYITPRDISLATYLFADPSVMFDRQKALKAGYDDEFENEKPLWYKLLNYGKGVIFEEPLIYVRWRLGSLSRGQVSIEKQASVNLKVRLKYDSENAKPLTKRPPIDKEKAILSREVRAGDIYSAAGDDSSARGVAFQTWIKYPFSPITLKMLLRSLGVKRLTSAPGVSGTSFTPVDSPW